MIVISTENGVCLSFCDIKDIKNTIINLEKMAQHMQSNAVEPPYVYGLFSDWISQEIANETCVLAKGLKHGRV